MSGIIDRGSKKWVSIMIPELREGLAQLFNEEVKVRPELDEQQLEELSWRIGQMWKSGRPVLIRYWDDGEREAGGRVARFELGQIRLVGEDGTRIHIQASDIIDVEVVE